VPRTFRFFCIHFCLVLLAILAAGLAAAQTLSVPRISQPIDDQQRVTLKGNVHPLARSRFDQGVVADSFPAQRMLLLLQRSPEQESALRQFLQDVHTPGNPSYHKWLTPDEFGKAYGPGDADVSSVTQWLQSRGFSVAGVAKGKTTIEFSGNAGQVRNAFHTEIHTYLIRGAEHHANNSDPQIPAALAPVVAGITPMNDFRPKSNAEVLGQAAYNVRSHQVTQQWTMFGLPDPELAVAPGDFAVQYDLNPLYSAGTNGTGVTIGIIGDSNVDPALVAAYRTLFGLPVGAFNVIVDGNDPGLRRGRSRRHDQPLHILRHQCAGWSLSGSNARGWRQCSRGAQHQLRSMRTGYWRSRKPILGHDMGAGCRAGTDCDGFLRRWRLGGLR
jgi:hypothetical protein